MVESEDHDEIVALRGEITRLWDRFAGEGRALDLAASQWPTRQELAQELSRLRNDLQTAGIPRTEYQAAHKALESRIDSLDKANTESLALTAQRARTTTWLIAAAGITIAFFNVVVGIIIYVATQ